MKRLAAALAVAALLCGPVHAGGMAEPQMEPAVIAADTASSGGDDWVVVMMTLLSVAAVVAN